MPHYKKTVNVICLGDPKQSALYFDSIVPISYFFELLCKQRVWLLVNKYSLPCKADLFTSIVPKEELLRTFSQEALVLPNLLQVDKADIMSKILAEYLELFTHILTWPSVVWKICSKKDKNEELYQELQKKFGGSIPHSVHLVSHLIANRASALIFAGDDYTLREPHMEGFFQGLLDLMGVLYMENCVVPGRKEGFRNYLQRIPDVRSGCRSIVFSASCYEYMKAEDDDISLQLSNIQMIDTSKTEWDKIVEFRKDETARRKLRNLRLFLHTNYGGRTLDYIADDLHKRLEEHEDACKAWGFETTTSTISAVMDSSSLLLMLGTALGSAILGAPDVLTVTASAGSLIEIGKIALGFAKSKHAFQKLKNDHELAYIIEAKERLE